MDSINCGDFNGFRISALLIEITKKIGKILIKNLLLS